MTHLLAFVLATQAVAIRGDSLMALRQAGVSRLAQQ
jgi:hypothetical protein